MAKCIDYPCCGHEDGGCPNEDGNFNCARCGARLPKKSHSAVCRKCHKVWQRQTDRGYDDFDYSMNY